MDKQLCGNCVHFHQHYVLDAKRIFRIRYGHCSFSRVKKRKPDDNACDHYVYAPPDQDAFVTKEFLSKTLLAYFLRLELLPEIQEDNHIG